MFKGQVWDVYREMYPDPSTHPGFTCPADCKDISLNRLVWSPQADDRERIDYIMYAPYEGLSLEAVTLIGTEGDILRGNRVTERKEDLILKPLGVWCRS